MRTVEDWDENAHGPIPVRLTGVPIDKHLRISEDGNVWYGIQTQGEERVVAKVAMSAAETLEKQAAGQRVRDRKAKKLQDALDVAEMKADIAADEFFTDKDEFAKLPADEKVEVQAELIRKLAKRVFDA